jgi:hypothetical protein
MHFRRILLLVAIVVAAANSEAQGNDAAASAESLNTTLSLSAQTTAALDLVPMPREIAITSGSAIIGNDWSIVAAPEDEYPAKLLAGELSNRIPVHIGVTDQSSSGIIAITTLATSPNDPRLFLEQGYTLDIRPDSIVVSAPSSAGRYYGVQTLRQLMRTHRASLPILHIRDYPQLEWRGISDDISRGQISTLDDFTKIIRDLAFYKKNLYQPYIEDMFFFDTDPNIGRGRGPITKAEMAAMVAEAKRNHVIIVPAFECLGHQDRLLSLPENRQYAELQDKDSEPWSFAPVSSESFDFVTQLIDELADATPAPFFHIGGDESWDVGKGLSKARVDKIGVGRVHAQWFAKLKQYLKKKHGREAMMYGDMLLAHPESLEILPKDAIVIDWGYGISPDHPGVKKMKKLGFTRIFVSPGIWSWGTFYPNYMSGFKSVAGFVALGKQENVMGSITSSWGDDGAENLRENNMTGYAFSAACEWQKVNPDSADFLRSYCHVRYGTPSERLPRIEKALGWQPEIDEANNAQIFHSTPRVKRADPAWLAKLAQLETKMKQTRVLIEDARQDVLFEADHLRTLDNVARRLQFAATKARVMDSIAQKLGSGTSADLSHDDAKAIQTSLEELRDEIILITNNYRSLWLHRNNFPMLQFNLERLNQQTAVLQEMIASTQAGELQGYREPDAEWFWAQESDPTTTATTGTRYFIRELDLPEKPVMASIKCFADDRANVYVNGAKVVQARYNKPAAESVVSDKLKRGRNYIAIEATNKYGAAGVLVSISLRFRDKRTEVITGDDKWLVAQKVREGWMERRPGKGWKPVMLLGKGLIKPWQNTDW